MCALFIAIVVFLVAVALVMSGAIWAAVAIVVECWPLILVIAILVMWRKSKKSKKS